MSAKKDIEKLRNVAIKLLEERKTLYTRLSEQATHLANLRTDYDHSIEKQANQQTLINLINSEFSSCKKLSDFRQLQRLLNGTAKSHNVYVD